MDGLCAEIYVSGFFEWLESNVTLDCCAYDGSKRIIHNITALYLEVFGSLGYEGDARRREEARMMRDGKGGGHERGLPGGK